MAFFGLKIPVLLTCFHLAENLWPEDFGCFVGLDQS